MALAKCTFCGCEQDDYKGTYLIKNDGTIIYYCSSKCRKNNLHLGRDRRRLKWTRAYREARVKREKAAEKAAEKVRMEHKPAHSEHKTEKAKK